MHACAEYTVNAYLALSLPISFSVEVANDKKHNSNRGEGAGGISPLTGKYENIKRVKYNIIKGVLEG